MPEHVSGRSIRFWRKERLKQPQECFHMHDCPDLLTQRRPFEESIFVKRSGRFILVSMHWSLTYSETIFNYIRDECMETRLNRPVRLTKTVTETIFTSDTIMWKPGKATGETGRKDNGTLNVVN